MSDNDDMDSFIGMGIPSNLISYWLFQRISRGQYIWSGIWRISSLTMPWWQHTQFPVIHPTRSIQPTSNYLSWTRQQQWIPYGKEPRHVFCRNSRNSVQWCLISLHNNGPAPSSSPSLQCYTAIDGHEEISYEYVEELEARCRELIQVNEELKWVSIPIQHTSHTSKSL